jgi:hypothetical protein
MKKGHDLRLCTAPSCDEALLPERCIRSELRLREYKLIIAEFMDFFSTFAFPFLQRSGQGHIDGDRSFLVYYPIAAVRDDYR